MDERRNYKRIQYKESIQYRFKSPHRFGGTLASDISEKGIRISIDDFVPLNSELSVQMQFYSGNIIECFGRVAWVSLVPYSDRYQIGVEFFEDDSFQTFRQNFESYINH